MDPLNFEKQIIQKIEKLLFVREEDGFDTALILWRELEKELADNKKELEPYVFDLLIQVEFLMEDDPVADLSEARHTLYVAKYELLK